MNQQNLSALIWSVADLLRGDYKQSEYGKVILPFTILRRLDCVLESTKDAVLAEYAEKKNSGIPAERSIPIHRSFHKRKQRLKSSATKLILVRLSHGTNISWFKRLGTPSLSVLG